MPVDVLRTIDVSCPHRLATGRPDAALCANCAIRHSALFKTLDPASLDRMRPHVETVRLPVDGAVFQRGVKGSAVYTLRSGLVRFERLDERGLSRIVRLAGPGELLGQESLLDRAYVDDARACTPVELCRIPSGLVQTLASEPGGMPRELMARWQDALDAAQTWTAELTCGPARARVLKLLAHLGHLAGPDGKVWLPRLHDIGNMLDLTLETASRQISALRKEGVLRRHPLRSASIDPVALQAALRKLNDAA